MPVAPSRSETARWTRTFIWSRLFCMRRSQSARSAISVALVAHQRPQHTDLLGRTERASQQPAAVQTLDPFTVASVRFRPARAPGPARACRPARTVESRRLRAFHAAQSSTPPCFRARPPSRRAPAARRSAARPRGRRRKDGDLSAVPSREGAHTQCSSLPTSIPATSWRSTGIPPSSAASFGHCPIGLTSVERTRRPGSAASSILV